MSIVLDYFNEIPDQKIPISILKELVYIIWDETNIGLFSNLINYFILNSDIIFPRNLLTKFYHELNYLPSLSKYHNIHPLSENDLQYIINNEFSSLFFFKNIPENVLRNIRLGDLSDDLHLLENEDLLDTFKEYDSDELLSNFQKNLNTLSLANKFLYNKISAYILDNGLDYLVKVELIEYDEISRGLFTDLSDDEIY